MKKFLRIMALNSWTWLGFNLTWLILNLVMFWYFGGLRFLVFSSIFTVLGIMEIVEIWKKSRN